MLVALTVAATVLASPPPLAVASQVPKGAVFLALPAERATSTLVRSSVSTPAVPEPGPFLGGLLDHLAVVKPHRSDRGAPPGPQLFVLIAPMKGQVGVHAVGSF
jgi:hypothetical protein